MLKLLIATPLYPPDSGGPATDSAMLYKKFPEKGIEASVYSFGEVRNLPRGIRHVRYLFGLLSRAYGADAILSMDTFSVCLPAAAASMILRKPLIVRVPGDYAWEQSVQRFGVTDMVDVFQKRRYGIRVEVLRALQNIAVRRAALVVAPSDFFKTIIQNWGIRPERLERVYLGLEPDESSTAPAYVPQGKIIFSAGRFVPWKGFSTLIDVLHKLPPEWHLVLAGDGPDRVSLEEKAQKLGVKNRMTFIGAVAHKEVFGWLRRADVFVLNTAYETFSFQILEAMIAGSAIISTSVGSIPELIENGVEGVLCKPNDADAFYKEILSIQTQSELWRERKEAAKIKSRRFSAEASADALAKKIQYICTQSRTTNIISV